MAKISELKRKSGTSYLFTHGTKDNRIRKAFKTYKEALAYQLLYKKDDTFVATLADAFQLYLQNSNYSVSTKANVNQLLKHVDTCLIINSIDTLFVRQLIEKLKKTRSNTSLLPIVSTFRSVLKTAMYNGFMKPDIFRSILFPPMKKARVRKGIFTPKVLQKMIEYCDKHESYKSFKDVIYFLYDTGVRWLSEMLRLKFCHVKEGRIHIPSNITKTKKSRIAVMTNRVRCIVRDRKLHKRPEDYIFDDYNKIKVQRRWNGVRSYILPFFEYDEEDCVLHTFRHSCVTRLVDNNVNPITIAQHIGHGSLAMIDLYATQNKKSTKIILEALED